MAIIISNTEITAKNTCDALHGYMYLQGLEPIKYSLSIRRGIAGHAILADYYKCRKDNWNHAAAVDYSTNTFYEIVKNSDPDDTDHTVMLGQLAKLLKRYFRRYENDTYKILAVEELMTAPMVEGQIVFGLYLDVLAEITTGEFRGYVDIIDHKFVNNFKTPDELRLDPQQPKYKKTADLNGLPIRNAIFNQIRYRQMKDPSDDDLFRRSPLLSSKIAVDTVWKEATETAEDIKYENTRDRYNTRRRQSYGNCKYCFFKDLCMAELAGQDTTIMRTAQYQKRNRPLKDWMLSNA
jgi:hypothetical protein